MTKKREKEVPILPVLADCTLTCTVYRIGAGELVCFFAGVEVEGEGAEDQNHSEYSISLHGGRRLDIPENLR
jgi:hypothetical protein